MRREFSVLAEGRHVFGLRPKLRAAKPPKKLFFARKAFRAGHYKDLTETGNRARKVSGTQGKVSSAIKQNELLTFFPTVNLSLSFIYQSCRLFVKRDSDWGFLFSLQEGMSRLKRSESLMQLTDSRNTFSKTLWLCNPSSIFLWKVILLRMESFMKNKISQHYPLIGWAFANLLTMVFPAAQVGFVREDRVFPLMAYAGRLSAKGVPFSQLRYIKR